jgi:hypothetical protein
MKPQIVGFNMPCRVISKNPNIVINENPQLITLCLTSSQLSFEVWYLDFKAT